MLRKAVLFSVLLMCWGVANAELFSDLNIFASDLDPKAFSWERPHFSTRSANSAADSGERDREPLAPDYKDPVAQPTENKPLETETKDKPVFNPKKENQGPKQPSGATNLPEGGIIDIQATGGFPSLGGAFGPGLDLPALGGFEPSGAGFGGFGLGGLFGLDDSRRWWKGENVCVEREESTDDEDESKQETEKKNTTESPAESQREPHFFGTSIRLSRCMESENKYECETKINNHGVLKTFTVRYRCCYGFKRTPESNGCTKQVELKPVLETLDDLKLDTFRSLIKSSGLDNKFESDNLTIFVPSEDGMQTYDENVNDMNKVEAFRRRRAVKGILTSKDLVLSHTTDGFFELADLDNEQILQSEDDSNSSIRINIYGTHTNEKQITANCARVTKANVLADNGIIHVVDRVIPPATESVEEIIRNHPKLTSFRKVLENTDIPSHFKENGHYTIFAATDEAFAKLDEAQRQKLLKGGSCASNILKYHIIAHTVCSAAIVGNATAHNVEGTPLSMERTPDDDVIFEGKAKVVDADILGTNGVIHLIDNLIIPESGQYIGSALKSQNFTKFQDIVERAGLSQELDGYDNATVFVPADSAFENPQTQKLLKEIGDDQEKLRELVKYHVIDGQVQSCDMSNNMKIQTKDEGQTLRVNLYSTLPIFSDVINRATVNCARLVGFDEKTCGSIVHEVSRVLVPPSENIYDLIQKEDKYSTLKELIKDTEVEKILTESNRSITFLAPTDESFAALEEKDMQNLRADKDRAEAVLKNHILSEVLCCSGVGPHTWGFNSFVPTLGNHKVEVGRTGSQVRFNGAVVTSCDNLATNGVLHTINRVLIPRRRAPVNPLGGGLLFFDL